MDAVNTLELLDWKRRVGEIYADVRKAVTPGPAWERWRRERAELFADHPQSPRRGVEPTYFPYDPAGRAHAHVEPAEQERFELPTSGEESMAFTRFATVHFDVEDRALQLDLYWLDGYGGGAFLPFSDATSGDETYGAGRYLLDTVKGADLGIENGSMVLDFNFAYNPSCAYDPAWLCPLAPPANRLEVPMRFGEKVPPQDQSAS
jgi:uncharacterized protein (DUF1684 family)